MVKKELNAEKVLPELRKRMDVVFKHMRTCKKNLSESEAGRLEHHLNETEILFDKSIDNLEKTLKKEKLELEILNTPTGEKRNKLTEELIKMGLKPTDL